MLTSRQHLPAVVLATAILVTAAKPYDWSEDVKKLAMPVMLVFGDSDMCRPERIVKFHQLLGGGRKDAGWARAHVEAPARHPAGRGV